MAPEETAEAESVLQSFERRFLAARTLRYFPWQSLEEKLRDSSGPELLLNILQKTVKHPLCVKHPRSVKYVRCFLSELIRKPSGDSVTLSESTAIVSHGTTGLVTWDAALYLAEWAIENPAAFAHRTVLELGSGAGLTGLAICKTCCPSTYVFSDCHSCVLEQLRGNILLNGLSLEPDTTDPERHPGHNAHDTESPRVTVAQLDWDVVTAPELAAFRPDVIIAADVLYCPETVISLVRVLQRLSACLKDQQAPEAYIAFTVRSPETCWLFTNELGQVGIPWEAVPHHNQKLFPYEEHSDMAILKLML
ncbi:PREDICTED: protein-lysine N-methyltransferase EEF2KMT isoform X2 [Odobenus rosmarus divergens]|uniref:Protein-lysine N-methyltransferase EEF2KMT isoform X2 n=1 Tax=Odobenus rosmarus divergens TaxID=9708 RepID=A0A2U3W5G0_ODORO|nr:PREDICTED: protein-lysine N-methyltransferase EEF2KMT isoform X2 [Odobenus rosmarus divergens]